MKIFTAAQIQKWEAQSMQAQGISSLALMQRAAIACEEWISHEPTLQNIAHFHICCGGGNNGGDGLALAALLLQGGRSVKTYLLPSKKQSADFKTNLRKLQALITEIISLGAE